MTKLETSHRTVKAGDRLLAAGYWKPRDEPSETSAVRVLGLLDDLDIAYPPEDRWRVVINPPPGEALGTDPTTAAEQLLRATRAGDNGLSRGILTSVLRDGRMSVRFALGASDSETGIPDNVVVYPPESSKAPQIVDTIVRHFSPAWAVFGTGRLRLAQRPSGVSALIPWLGAVTYLPGSHQAPEGATATPLGDGTLIDFTQAGTVEPDDATILAAVDQVLPRAD